jgi:sulfotransferase 6B1
MVQITQALVILGLALSSCVLAQHSPDQHRDVSPRETPKVFYSSIMQCGTHLLKKCLQLMTKRPENWIHGFDSAWSRLKKNPRAQVQEGRSKLFRGPANAFSGAHMSYRRSFSAFLKHQGYVPLFIYRDPRAHVISRAYKIVNDPQHYPMAARYPSSSDFPRLISDLIRQVPRLYKRFMPWKDDPSCYAIRFEDLVGPDGGGTVEAQQAVLKGIAEHIKIPYTDDLIKYCGKHVFGGTYTFRKGQIESWQKAFTNQHRTLFKKVAGQLLIDLGYEKDLDW